MTNTRRRRQQEKGISACFSPLVSLLAKAEKAGVGRGQSGLDADPVELCRKVFPQQSLAPSLGHSRPCPILLRDFSSCLSHHPKELEAGTASSFGGWVKSFHAAG